MGIYPEVDNTDEVSKTVPDSKRAASADSKYKGQPGPQDNRQCRDVFWLILFILFWCGMFVIAGLAIQQGNLNRLRYGNDTEGNLCGVNNAGGRDHTNAPYQYVFDPTNWASYRQCVTHCPNQTFTPICPYDVPVPTAFTNINLTDFTLLAQLYANGTFGNCTFTYRTIMVLNRCLPDVSALVSLSNITGANGTIVDQVTSTGTEMFSDVYNSWKIILICSAISLVMSFIWMFMMQYASKFMVWFTVIFVNFASIAFTAVIFNYWNQVRTQNGTLLSYSSVGSASNNEKVLLAISILAAILTFVLVILTITLRSRINLAIAVIGEASKAIRKMPLIVFFPVFKYVLLAGLTAWIVYVWACLVTSGSKVSGTIGDQISNRTSVQFTPNEAFNYLTIYYALGYFWTFNFIIAIAQTTIAGAVASWYWSRDKANLPSAVITRAFARTMRYHLGSLALGSLIIAIIETIRAIVFYFQQQLRKQKASKVAQCCLACVQCCLACFERFMKFINKNAYIEIAVYGYSFCSAAKEAFELLVRNAIRVIVVDRVSDFLFFLGKVLITAVVAIIGSSLLQNPEQLPDGETLNIGRFWSVSLLIIIILSYVIASSFMAVYEMAIDTVFLCFCEDSERNDGSAQKPYYMEESLRKFVDDANKKAAPKV
ncbi:hypothetical protein MIR68_011544 [Amoeboaphelidium protococcarum]|nr:hypothetical protein MIR68_011544 [Amoeboaphelidium protococcarum]